jgi:hypothetical protein
MVIFIMSAGRWKMVIFITCRPSQEGPITCRPLEDSRRGVGFYTLAAESKGKLSLPRPCTVIWSAASSDDHVTCCITHLFTASPSSEARRRLKRTPWFAPATEGRESLFSLPSAWAAQEAKRSRRFESVSCFERFNTTSRQFFSRLFCDFFHPFPRVSQPSATNLFLVSPSGLF